MPPEVLVQHTNNLSAHLSCNSLALGCGGVVVEQNSSVPNKSEQ